MLGMITPSQSLLPCSALKPRQETSLFVPPHNIPQTFSIVRGRGRARRLFQWHSSVNIGQGIWSISELIFISFQKLFKFSVPCMPLNKWRYYSLLLCVHSPSRSSIFGVSNISGLIHYSIQYWTARTFVPQAIAGAERHPHGLASCLPHNWAKRRGDWQLPSPNLWRWHTVPATYSKVVPRASPVTHRTLGYRLWNSNTTIAYQKGEVWTWVHACAQHIPMPSTAYLDTQCRYMVPALAVLGQITEEARQYRHTISGTLASLSSHFPCYRIFVGLTSALRHP